MPWVQGDGGAYWKDDEPLSDQRYITTYTSDEFGNYFPQQVENPNYDIQRYDPEEYQRRVAYANTQRGGGGLAGFLSKGPLKRIGDAISEPVRQVSEGFYDAASQYALPAIGAALTGGVASEFLLPGLMGAGAPATAGGTNALSMAGAPAGFQTPGALGFGGATFGAPSTLAGAQAALAAAASGVPAAAAAAAPTVTNSLAPAAASGLSNYLAPALGAAGQVAGAVMADRSISSAADAAAASADKNLAFQREMFNTIRADQEPFRAAGVSALGKLSPLMDYKKFSMEDFVKDPGYNFRLTQGQQALDRSAAARGGLQSGAALKAATEFGQQMGSQEYTNAFNRYGIERDRAINPLMQVAGFGQTATNNMQQGATNYGNTAGQIMQNAGDTAANAQLARGSTYANTGNQLAQILSRYGRV